MKKNIISLVFAVVTLLVAGTACVKEYDTVLNKNRSTDTDISEYLPKITYGAVNLGTFNLLYGSYKDNANYTWDVRKNSLAQAIVANDFDVFGVQEADKTIREQLPDLVKAAAPQESTRDYKWWFVCRDNQAATTGEAIGIVYDANKYTISDQHYFWLTDKDPDTMNVGWDETSYHRMACCAVLTQNNDPEQKFFLMVTHMPLASVARQGAAALINTREAMYNKDQLPSFLLGDMNSTPDDPAIATFTNSKWNDSYAKVPAASKQGNVITFHGKKDISDMTNAENRIDYIFYKNISKVLTYKVDYNKYNGYYPSDHCAVSISFDIPKAEPVTLQGTGTAEDPYQITSIEEWAAVAKAPAEACYKLTANLDFTGKKFVRMAEFNGTLDGAGHKMVGISGEAEAENFGGIINVLGSTGIVKDLNVEANLSSAFKNLGGVVGIDTAGSLIDGVTFRGNLTGTGACSRIGGIIGTSYSVIVNCGCLGGEFLAPEATKSENIGGIAGRIEQNTAIMANCYSFLDKIVSSNNNLGGVTGGLGTNAYCVNVYGITSDITGGTSCGCIGYSKSGNIRNVYSATDKYVANDKQASDWLTCGASLTLDNMKSGAVALPSSGVSYKSFVEALNAGIEDWNALENITALKGKDVKPYGIVNKPDVTLRKWEVGANGYPVVSAVSGGNSGTEGPIGDPIVVNIVFKDYAADHGWIDGTDPNKLTEVYTLVEKNGVKIVAGGNEGELNGVYNAPSYYDWRFYQNRGGKVTISVPDGYRIQSVAFDYNLEGDAAYNKGGVMLTPDGKQCLDATETEITPVQEATFVVGNTGTATNGQARILSISVKYVAWGVDPGTGGGEPTSMEVDFKQYGADQKWTDSTSYPEFTKDGVTFTASWTNGGSANGIFYVGNETTPSDWRFYQARGGGLTISVGPGKTLVKVKFTYANKNNGIILAPDGSTVATDTDFAVSGESVMFKAGSSDAAQTAGQARIRKIVVEYK